jgi:hypothetical protein
MKKKKKELGIKLGSDEMVFWRDVIEAKKIDIKTTEDNLKFYKAIVKMAEQKYKEAEQKFNAQ